MIQLKISFQKIAILLAGFLLLLPADLTLAYTIVFKNNIYPNIYVLKKNLGGQKAGQAKLLLDNLIMNSPQALVLNGEGKSWKIDFKSIGVSYDTKTTVNHAYAIGRNQTPFRNILNRWQLVYKPITIPPAVNFDQSAWQNIEATISAQINQPAIPPTITITGIGQYRRVEISSGSGGKNVDIKLLDRLLSDRLNQLDSQPIDLKIIPILPQVSQKQAEAAKQRAEHLLNKYLILNLNNQSWTLNDEEMVSFLDFTNGFDEQKIASWTAQLTPSTDRPPQNAIFQFENNKVIEFKPALDGITLDQESAAKQISESINKLENNPDNTISLELPVKIRKPEISTDKVNNLGIKELIGTGQSWFKGSIAGRVHNINLAAQKINGALIAPQETFSFNLAVGEIDKSTGYAEAYIIKDGRTVLGDGGGVCQVSTTLFRAALNAGLPIEERQAHAYRVSYYEQNSQVGQDATVFAPSPNLRFKNDTPGHILIQTIFNKTQSKLTFELYGTNDGRHVTISKTRIWDQVAPPPDLFQDDPSLPAGTVKQVDWKAWGAKTSFDWKVVRNGEILQNRTFYSNYRPWQAVFLKGTGG